MPFEIPGNWVWCKIEDIGEVITGNTPSKDRVEYYGGDTPFFKPTDLDQGIDTRYASDHLSELGFEQSRKLPANTILVTCIGATIGKTGIITVAGSCNQQINAIVPNKEVTHSYIFYVCVSNYMQSEIISNASATTLPILNKSNFANLLFPLPPIAEQHRIVKEIGHWFALIDQIEQDKSDLQIVIKQAKSKILDLAIHGKLVPQDPNDEPASELLKRINPKAEITCDKGHSKKLPQNWSISTVGNVLQLKSGENIKVRQLPMGGKYPIYGGNVINGFYNKCNVSESTIIIGRVGFYCGSVFLTESKAWVTDNALIVSGYEGIYNTIYLAYLLQYLNLGKVSNSTAQPVISRKGINPIQILIPPLSEQQRIVTKIEKLFSVLDNIQNALEA